MFPIFVKTEEKARCVTLGPILLPKHRLTLWQILSYPSDAQESPEARTWFPEAFQYLNTELGERWRELLTRYIDFERASGWAQTPIHGYRRFPVTSAARPTQLTKWIINGRYERMRSSGPKFDHATMEDFVDTFMKWWASLQPSWRSLGVGNKLSQISVYGNYWKSLNVPGKNGWLSIMACLKWWGVYVAEKEKAQWAEVVEDVLMMLNGLITHVTM